MSSHNVSDAGSNADSKAFSGSSEDYRTPSPERNDVRSSDRKEEEGVEVEPSDGDLRAWLRVLGAFLVLANTMGGS